jgi:hypothetical protein
VSIFDLISIEITIPNIVSSAAYTGPLWILILGFMIAFSVIFLAAGKIPLFRDAPSKGPHKMFSIAVSLMVIFSTPFLTALLGLVGTFTSLSMIAVLILGIYTDMGIIQRRMVRTIKSTSRRKQDICRCR